MNKLSYSASIDKPLLNIFAAGIILGLLFFLIDLAIAFFKYYTPSSVNNLILSEIFGTILYLLISSSILLIFMFLAHIVFLKGKRSFQNILHISMSFTFFLLISIFIQFSVNNNFSLRVIFILISILCTYGFYNITKKYWVNKIIFNLIFIITSYILTVIYCNLLIYIKIISSFKLRDIKYIFLSLPILISYIYLIKICYKYFIKKIKIRKGVIIIYPFIIIIAIIPLLRNLNFDNKEYVSSNNTLNVVILILDALRADCLGCYGSNVKTPNIDKLAKEGIVFENAFSQAPLTLPSMVSFFSSYNPSVNKLNNLARLSDKNETLAEELRSRGYRTCALVGNHLLGESSGVLQGFGNYLILDYVKYNRYLYQLPIIQQFNKIFHKYFYENPLPDTSKVLTKKALKFLQKNYKYNFYLWIHYMDPHDPYSPAKEYCNIDYRGKLKSYFAPDQPFWGSPLISHIRGGYYYLNSQDKKYIKSLYEGEIAYLDHHIGKVLSEIEKLGIEEKTIIILTSDHGEEFWEHGDFLHGQSLYDELINVPLIIKSPTLSRGKKVKSIARLTDVMPTIREFLQLPINEKMQGHSLISIINSKNEEENFAFSEETEFYEDRKSIRTQQYKLILGMDTKRVELYDVVNDPYEKEDLSTKKPTIAKKLTEKLLNIIIENKNYSAEFNKGRILDKEKQDILDLKKRLKALGYIK